jgi:hypothetical protein
MIPVFVTAVESPRTKKVSFVRVSTMRTRSDECQGLKLNAKFFLSEVAVRKFSEVQLDLTGNLANNSIRPLGQAPSFGVEPVAELREGAFAL